MDTVNIFDFIFLKRSLEATLNGSGLFNGSVERSLWLRSITHSKLYDIRPMRIPDWLAFWRTKKQGFYLGEIEVKLAVANKGIRLQCSEMDLFFEKQDLISIKSLLLNNYSFVREHFQDLGTSLPDVELDELSARIIIEHLLINNVLRNNSTSYAELDLSFTENDLYTASTRYDVVNIIKAKHPADYAPLAAKLLEMSATDFARFEEIKREFEGVPAEKPVSKVIQPEITRIA